MPSNTATAVMQPPRQVQAGNAPILGERAVQEEFILAMEREGGYLKACRALGISHMAVARQRVRDPLFAAEVELALEEMRTRQAEAVIDLAREHIRSHLDGPDAWEYERDPETGDLVLDDDLEPVRRSRVPMKSAVEAHREMRATIDRGEGLQVQVNNVAQAAARAEADARAHAPAERPVLVDPSAEDAEVLDDAQAAPTLVLIAEETAV